MRTSPAADVRSREVDEFIALAVNEVQRAFGGKGERIGALPWGDGGEALGVLVEACSPPHG